MKVKLISTTEPFITIPKRSKYMNGIKYTTTKLYYWQHYNGFKIIIREEKPENLIDQLNLHDLEYQHNSVYITF
jgi:hypothetical protein